MDDLIQNVYLYFARFPKFESLARSFNKGSSHIAGYADFKSLSEAITVRDVVPEINDYVFGVNLDRVKMRIDNIGSYYLLVDYGNIEAMPNSLTGHTQNMFNIAVTVAHPVNADRMDDADEVLISSHCLDYLRAIKNRMKTDSRETLVKDLRSNYQAVPFVASELNGSIGWTLTFTRDGVLL